MDNVKDHLDEIESEVMGKLKDFQKATVERIDYLYRHGKNRVLVSDEVGLGKTLIARGTIAKFSKLRKEEGDDLVKVIYICSNSTIAQQNLDKLMINHNINVENGDASRLSMQHLNIFKQEHNEEILKNYIQLIALTPKTSFEITNSPGTMQERALIFTVLKRYHEFAEIENKLYETFRHGINSQNWMYNVNYYEYEFKECNEKSGREYEKYMLEELDKKLTENFRKSFYHFCKNYTENTENRKKARKYIMKLRKIFADISLNKLEPDLIILDEFQRFKNLLNDDSSEMGQLTHKFFNSKDVRILLLSATPYKMYSTLDEIDETQLDSHYSEFFDVMKFLKTDVNEEVEFKEVWRQYSIELKEFSSANVSLITAKNSAEQSMFDNICRTERISERTMGDFIDDENIKNYLPVFKEDITSFIEIQKILDETGINRKVPVDYIKSTPYIMSFMMNYKLKSHIEKYFSENPEKIDLINKDMLWLNEKDIDEFKEIPLNNCRLACLMDYVLKDNAELLLWAPPTKPYYPLDGAYKNSGNFSKTLIFSSWEMVPRMISSLVSYEIERKTIAKVSSDNPNAHYFSKRRYPYPRMTFSLKNNVTSQMSTLTLVYASEFLIDCYDPIDCLNRKLTLSEIEDEIKSKINEKLSVLSDSDTSREDMRWYYLAPLLLDSLEDENYVKNWFIDFYNSDIKANDLKGFKAHIKELQKQFREIQKGTLKLGKKPEDLAEVLCDITIASPANCIYRTYKKEAPESSDKSEYRKLSITVSKTFINRMNLPQSIAAVDLSTEKNYPHWRKLLIYSKEGNIQAMFDEYAHLLGNNMDKNNPSRIQTIHSQILESIELRATSYEFDTFNDFKSKIQGEKTPHYLRTHFAASFIKGKDTTQDANRKKTVRNAFNSPFRPFVLASTSIGQEGLDFHNYCRRIVHWNLPSNPIDLEQREGRINRFECLAIRQNIAKRYGDIKFKKDVWSEMFDRASEVEKEKNCSDLIPYWGLKESEDMVKIERIVPMYPFSQDLPKYERLIKILSLYRLTLGQTRQEELIEYLLENNIENYDFNDLFINLSPYYKKIN